LLKLIALFVLALGLGAGATIYFTADDPTTSKTYVSQLERFGGKRLGISIVCVSAAAAAVLFALAKVRSGGSS
jgi:hypothetical protein